MAVSMQLLLIIGSDPGWAVQVGQIWLFGLVASNSCVFSQLQKSLCVVLSLMCTSSQIV